MTIKFAYGKHSSTTVALIITVDAWKFAIDKGKKVVCAFLDLRKAFDVIDHDILISKLSKQGINEKELEWFKSYKGEINLFHVVASNLKEV